MQVVQAIAWNYFTGKLLFHCSLFNVFTSIEVFDIDRIIQLFLIEKFANKGWVNVNNHNIYQSLTVVLTIVYFTQSLVYSELWIALDYKNCQLGRANSLGSVKKTKDFFTLIIMEIPSKVCGIQMMTWHKIT